MKMYIIAILACILPASLCWQYQGYPGVDCPTAREKMIAMALPENERWMIPVCHDDGTFVDLQCYEKYQNVCACVAPDGSPLTLPGMPENTTTCVCWNEQYRIYLQNPDAYLPRCANDGYFLPLQCSRSTGECWCVDKHSGAVVVPPSEDVHTCP